MRWHTGGSRGRSPSRDPDCFPSSRFIGADTLGSPQRICGTARRVRVDCAPEDGFRNAIAHWRLNRSFALPSSVSLPPHVGGRDNVCYFKFSRNHSIAAERRCCTVPSEMPSMWAISA